MKYLLAYLAILLTASGLALLTGFSFPLVTLVVAWTVGTAWGVSYLRRRAT